MIKNLNVYREINSWKRPLHLSKAYLAKNYLKLLKNTEVIGITGSVGKTLTQNAIYSVLSQKFRTVVGDENLDPTFRIPQTILKAKPWDQKIILEYGVEKPGDMDHYLSIVIPKIAVVTNIWPTHLKYFKSVEGVSLEKSKLIKSLSKDKIAVLNADDSYCHKMAKETKAKIIWYGKKAKNGVKISHFTQSIKGSKFRLHYRGQKATVTWKLIGEHQLLSAYAASAVGINSGLTLKQIAKGLSQVKVPEHRLTPIVSKRVQIIDDAYNASPKATLEAINTLVSVGKNKKKILVLGEMKDLGKSSNLLHQEIGKKIAKTKINYLITIEDTAKTFATSAKKYGFLGQTYSFSETKTAISKIKKLLTKNTITLVKGSRHAHLERIVNGLLGKDAKTSCYHCGTLD